MTVIRGINLFPKQLELTTEVLNSTKRFIAMNASRQFSKSTILENILMYRSLNEANSKCLYVTPTYALAKIVMNKLYNNLQESGVINSYNKSDNLITFINKSEIYFRSAQNADTIRGLSMNYLFIDEASFMSDDAWNIMRPTMNVIGKQCIMASTPRGKTGFFYQSCMLGQSNNDNYLYLFGHYRDNPFYSKLEVEDAKLTLPDNVFQQEYEAVFLDDGGSVFRNVKNCQTILSFVGNKQEGPYSIGIDLGRQNDFTVVTVLNNKSQVVEIFRDNKKDWTNIISSVSMIIKKYPGATIFCETNGIGDVVFDLLRKTIPSIRPFLTTNETKNEIIEELILAFQTEKVQIPTEKLFPILSQELNTYTFVYSPRTRRVIYNSMNGFNDDCVMSLAIALKAKSKKGGTSFSVV